MDIELKNIRDSMKSIIEQTNNVLKHSACAFKKTKQKLVILNDIKMKPNEKTAVWFLERNIETVSIPDFFELLFREASSKDYLDFDTKTIMFDEKEANIFGFEPLTKVPILVLFENVPNYFE